MLRLKSYPRFECVCLPCMAAMLSGLRYDAHSGPLRLSHVARRSLEHGQRLGPCLPSTYCQVVMSVAISDAAIRIIADAIYLESPSAVIEAYSAFGEEARTFASSQELCAYANLQRNSRDPSVHVAVHYPDMAGRVAITRVALDPARCAGHTWRQSIDGWGLIQVYLQLGSESLGSFVSANSEKRANAWAATIPDLDPPAVWDWPAVARHLRRLRRALKQAIP